MTRDGDQFREHGGIEEEILTFAYRASIME